MTLVLLGVGRYVQWNPQVEVTDEWWVKRRPGGEECQALLRPWLGKEGGNQGVLHRRLSRLLLFLDLLWSALTHCGEAWQVSGRRAPTPQNHDKAAEEARIGRGF